MRDLTPAPEPARRPQDRPWDPTRPHPVRWVARSCVLGTLPVRWVARGCVLGPHPVR